MRVLCDEIHWDVAEGFDVTALPVIDVIDIFDEDYDEEEFFEALYDALEERHTMIPLGCSYQVLRGTLH